MMKKIGIVMLLLLFLALPAGAQQLNPGGGGGVPMNLTNVNINGVVNVNTYPGSDLGQKINNAITSLPLNGYNRTPRGTLLIPNGTYTLSTTALIPPDVSVECDKGAIVYVTGSIGFDQNVWDTTHDVTNQEFSAPGGIDNCLIDGSQAPDGAIGIQSGDDGGFHYVNDKLLNFNQPNDVAMNVVNKQYFTEHFWIKNLILEQDTGGLTFREQCLPAAQAPVCQNSMMYGFIDIPHCGTAYGYAGASNGANAYCVGVFGGANLGRPQMTVHCNLDGNTGVTQKVFFLSNETATSAEHSPSEITFGNIQVQCEDNGPMPGNDYWVYADTLTTGTGSSMSTNQGQFYGNSGTNIQYPVSQSYPIGKRLIGDPFAGQRINLAADSGMRFGDNYWSVGAGWSLLPGAIHDFPSGPANPGPGGAPGGGTSTAPAGLNALGVLGTGAATTAGQIGSINFPLPKSTLSPTCHWSTGSTDPNNFSTCIWACVALYTDMSHVTAGNAVVSFYSGDNSHSYSFVSIPAGQGQGFNMNNCFPLDATGGGHYYVNPNGITIASGQYFMFGAPMIQIGTDNGEYFDSLYGAASFSPHIGVITNVAGLPHTPITMAGQNYYINDYNGTPGPCVSGGVYRLGEAIWDGSAWQCH